ncbi:hypothetical protein K2173_011084 [Erythroxylum novogranatense]|uniref:Uncharacterized protein n=1 Tax=Erythroxylum novogranatense TaxID=1862640 RepID=A0AAV8T277_9ROSI|nr:hypothetical protein K2173_012943 [Erythroxylum novogranatense]KAJ8760214.1 hypothetical protein K2173_011084 [Erythroxylum novogranatense]
MEKKRQAGASSSLDHLFGPKPSSSSTSSSSSSSSAEIFGSIFSPPSTVMGRSRGIVGNQVDSSNYENKGESSSGSVKNETSSVYQNESVEPSYLSSSIYYGGQENYSPRTKNSESDKVLKKDGGDDDPNGNGSNGASRGNWWQGSLYY